MSIRGFHRLEPGKVLDLWRAEYEVIESLKGAVIGVGSIVDLRTGAGSCAVGVEPGQTVLVFVYDDAGSVDLCGGTTVLRSLDDPEAAARVAEIRRLTRRTRP